MSPLTAIRAAAKVNCAELRLVSTNCTNHAGKALSELFSSLALIVALVGLTISGFALKLSEAVHNAPLQLPIQFPVKKVAR